MKKGCLLYLLAWACLSGAYYYLAFGTDLGGKPWIPVLLALSAVIAAANLLEIFNIATLKAAVKRPMHQLRDGKRAVASGRLRLMRDGVTAPFSGSKAAIVEYSIKRSATRESASSGTGFVTGFLMAPCSITSLAGSMRLVGFPLMASIPERNPGNPSDYQRAVDYIRATNFQVRSGNPLQLLKQLNEVLSDEDGEVKADFKDPNTPIDFLLAQDGADSSDVDNGGAEDDEEEELYEEIEMDPASFLHECGHELTEKTIEDGAEITVVGTFSQRRQAIEVGSAFQNLGNDIYLGGHDAVFGKKMRSSVIALIFWGALAAGAHFFAAKAIGLL